MTLCSLPPAQTEVSGQVRSFWVLLPCLQVGGVGWEGWCDKGTEATALPLAMVPVHYFDSVSQTEESPLTLTRCRDSVCEEGTDAERWQRQRGKEKQVTLYMDCL